MPVPFRDNEEVKELGLAAYLKIEPEKSGYRGAIFMINGRGEPVEFTYTRIEVPHTFLWREADIWIHAAHQMVTSLFSLCRESPKLILCRAGEVNSELFCRSVSVPMPVCRIAPSAAVVYHDPAEFKEETTFPEPVQLFWFPFRPAEDAIEFRLFYRLLSSGLLVEPFERAAAGLSEVYKSDR